MPPSADEAASLPDIHDIEIIKVTVERREEDLARYAGSAEAYPGDVLMQKGVTTVRRLAQITPFLHLGDQEGNVEVYIRGIGSDNNTEVGDPATAVHLDGVYVARPRGVGAMLFDIERVEVNRGPQGTLRGRNAMAGTINVISRKPDLKSTAFEGSLQVGTQFQRLERATLNLPLGDNLAVRMAMMAETHDPFYENARPGSAIQASESADSFGVRATALWLPFGGRRRTGPLADDDSNGSAAPVTVTLGADFLRDKGTGSSGSKFSIGQTPVDDPRKVVYRSPQGQMDSYHAGARAEITVDAGPVSAQALVSYRRLDYRQTTGGDLGVWHLGATDATTEEWSHTEWHTRSESVVQEFRFYAPDKNRWRWTIGAFGFYEAQRVFLGKIQDLTTGYVGTEFNMPDVKGLSFAGYVDNSFDITDRLRVMAGVRLTRESKFRTGIANNYRFQASGAPFRMGTQGFAWAGFDRTDYSNDRGHPGDVLVNGIARFAPDDNLSQIHRAVNAAGVSDVGCKEAAGASSASDISCALSQVYSEDFLDGRVGVAWDLSPSVGSRATSHLLYTTLSTGHHSGGFNDNRTPYHPERLYSLETGWKIKRLLPGLSLHVAGFFYSYTQMQSQNIQNEQAERSNASNARVFGLEATTRFRLPTIRACGGAGGECWRFYLSAELSALAMDARFGFGSQVVLKSKELTYPVDLENHWLPKAPRLTVQPSLSCTIDTPVGSFNGYVSALMRSKHYLSIHNGDPYLVAKQSQEVSIVPYDEVPPYVQIDLGVAFAPNAMWRVDGFITNVTNVAFATSLIHTPSMNLRFYNPPRQMGLRATVYF